VDGEYENEVLEVDVDGGEVRGGGHPTTFPWPVSATSGPSSPAARLHPLTPPPTPHSHQRGPSASRSHASSHVTHNVVYSDVYFFPLIQKRVPALLPPPRDFSSLWMRFMFLHSFASLI
jgi:hypothetical protein